MTTAIHEMPKMRGAAALSWIVPPIAVLALLGAMILAYAIYRTVML